MEFLISLPLYNILVGGLIVVGVVMFLLGILKGVLFNRIKNKLIRKIILSFGSLVLVIPFTYIYILYNGIDISQFLLYYAVHSLETILVYWLYENTGLRNFVLFVGEKTVLGFFDKLKRTQDLKKSIEEQLNESKKLVDHAVESRYKEDDLNKL